MRRAYGRNHLRRAVALVGEPGDRPPGAEALAEAFAHVWAAVAFCEDWPPGDRADLAGLIVMTRRHGSCADTAWRMTADEVRDFRRELVRVVARSARVPEPLGTPDAARRGRSPT